MRIVIPAVAMAWWMLSCNAALPFFPTGQPDAGHESSGIDNQLPCGGTRADLAERKADLLLVVDRSGSMTEKGADGLSKWEEILGSLKSVLGTIQTEIPMGLLLFPKIGAIDRSCGETPDVNVPIMVNNANAIQNALGDYAASPNGMTPTSMALQAATRYFQGLDNSAHHYILLATDGAPNCNAKINPRGCTCSAPLLDCSLIIDRNMPQQAAEACLDDVGTIGTIQKLAQRGVQTFVVGLPGVEGFASVLQGMADAGRRPRAGQTHYYNPTSRDELTAALSTITQSLVGCSFHLTMPPDNPEQVEVRLGSRVLTHDKAHTNGWDWTDTGHQDIVFFGEACQQVQHVSGDVDLVAAFNCPVPG